MAANANLIQVEARGWSAGLANLMSRELADWWKTRRWWTGALIWLLIIDGILFLAVSSPNSGETISRQTPVEQAVMLYCIFSGYFCPIGVMIATQGAIVGEKQNGTAAWILSKPVARTAFILTKLLANTLGFLVTMILIPGLGAYLIMNYFGLVVPVGAYLVGIGLIYLNLLFFQTFTLMMGTLVNSRGAVIGVSMVLLFLLNQLAQMSFGIYLPAHLAYDAGAVMLNQPVTGTVSLLLTVFLSALFIAVAFWRFAREEF